METRKDSVCRENNIAVDRVQDNHSKSAKWVLRGMHFQTLKPQAKLVRVTSWSVYDVAIDCRKWSPTYGQRYGVVLSADNKKQLYVPVWFAHGFLTLEDDTEFLYKVSDVYDASGEWGLQRDDEYLSIDRDVYMKKHNIQKVSLSEKDTAYQGFEDLPDFFTY